LTNEALRQANVAARIDHRSLAAQGINREPALQLPLHAIRAERMGQRSETAERLREKYNERIQAQLNGGVAHAPTDASPADAHSPRAPDVSSPQAPSSPVRRGLEEIRRQAREEWLKLRQIQTGKPPPTVATHAQHAHEAGDRQVDDDHT